MIRLFFVLILFLIYGNFSLVINDIVVLSLINIAFYTVIKEKNIKVIDVFIFILSTFVIEVFVGLPILIGVVVLFIPLVLLNYFITPYKKHEKGLCNYVLTRFRMEWNFLRFKYYSDFQSKRSTNC